jgi:DNA-binding FrmR family transcriptional regulator
MGEDTELYRVLGRIEGKIDAIHVRQESQAKDLDDVIKRVTALEKSMAWWAGGAAAIGAVIGYLLQVLKIVQ